MSTYPVEKTKVPCPLCNAGITIKSIYGAGPSCPPPITGLVGSHACPEGFHIRIVGRRTEDELEVWLLSKLKRGHCFNSPAGHTKPKDKALSRLIQALHDPLNNLLKNPFKRKKEKP